MKKEVLVMVLQAYEITNQAITGYKLYEDGVQVATLEHRSNQWIAGIFDNFKIKTMTTDSFQSAYYWIESTLKNN